MTKLSKKIKTRLYQLTTNSWTITLTATMIGVFAAVYTNNWMASRQVEKQKSVATKNILEELSTNEKGLGEAVEKHKAFLSIFRFLDEYMDEENNLIASVSNMNAFRAVYPEVITLTDSVPFDEERFKYTGEMNLDVSLPQLSITNIAWNTLKSSGIGTAYDFSCMMFLESVDKIEQEIIRKNNELLDLLLSSDDQKDFNSHFVHHLKLLIEYEESLLEVYGKREERLNNCR